MGTSFVKNRWNCELPFLMVMVMVLVMSIPMARL
jgi:hypothetical protein